MQRLPGGRCEDRTFEMECGDSAFQEGGSELSGDAIYDLKEFCLYYAFCALPVLLLKPDIEIRLRLLCALAVFFAFGSLFVLAKSFYRRVKGERNRTE